MFCWKTHVCSFLIFYGTLEAFAVKINDWLKIIPPLLTFFIFTIELTQTGFTHSGLYLIHPVSNRSQIDLSNSSETNYGIRIIGLIIRTRYVPLTRIHAVIVRYTNQLSHEKKANGTIECK